jgi:FkbM family methyltransferase
MENGLFDTMYYTPILLIIFNRPETAKRVLDQIRILQPTKLYIAADGPRHGVPGDSELCKKTRETILHRIDWDCEVHKLFREENLGCGVAPSTSITWFFENEEAGVILEDDCLPSLSFFAYAEYCLHKYRNNPRVMHIGGNNFLGKNFNDQTYFYSAYNHVWGWATWRRAWSLYTFDLRSFDRNELSKALDQYFPKSIRNGWLSFYDSLKKRAYIANKQECDFWDYQWSFCIWLNQGLCIYPNVNLVSNIGFGPGATHTLDVSNSFNNLPFHELTKIVSPSSISTNKKADIISSETVFSLNKQVTSPVSVTKFIDLKHKALVEVGKIARRIVPRFVKEKIRKVVYPASSKYISAKTSEQIELERIASLQRYETGYTTLIQDKFRFVDSASFLFMYDEIFKSQIYTFKSESETPFIIDCGANIGISIHFFKNLYPDAHILAFEPDPKVFKVLYENTCHFKNVLLKESALWFEDKKMNFYSEGADGGSLNEVPVTIEKIEIQTERLSTYLTRRVEFLKIDIEGSELDVLAECENKLFLVQHIFIEYHSFVGHKQKLAALVHILERNGFRYYINSPGLSSAQPFVNLNTYNGMDMQLNIYAFKR